MMTSMKYMLLIIVITIFSPSSVWASMVGDEHVKITILAHTGQDPVHSSYGGNIANYPSGWSSPDEGDIKLNILRITIEVMGDDLDQLLIEDFPNTPIMFGGGTTAGSPSISIVDSEIHPRIGGHPIPAPQALPLLLLGFASLIRRRS